MTDTAGSLSAVSIFISMPAEFRTSGVWACPTAGAKVLVKRRSAQGGRAIFRKKCLIFTLQELTYPGVGQQVHEHRCPKMASLFSAQSDILDEVNLDPKICARARRARDPRFDGRFFIGVLTATRIYCRPICPARSPRRRKRTLLSHRRRGRGSRLRPCLRCRPECSPGTPAWLGTSATVSRALKLITESALEDGGMDALAARLGIGCRHIPASVPATSRSEPESRGPEPGAFISPRS